MKACITKEIAAAGAAAFVSILLVGCASTSNGDSAAGKVWMRDGSTANSEFDENSCRATASTAEDFRLCMLSAGWRLETPPSP